MSTPASMTCVLTQMSPGSSLRQLAVLSGGIEVEQPLLVLDAISSAEARRQQNLVIHRQSAEYVARHVHGVADDERERARLVCFERLRPKVPICRVGFRPFEGPLCLSPPRETLVGVERDLQLPFERDLRRRRPPIPSRVRSVVSGMTCRRWRSSRSSGMASTMGTASCASSRAAPSSRAPAP